MKRNKLYKSLLFSGCALLMGGLSSCDDFLTVHPSNQIIEEEFWQDKSDLQSAVAGCYRQMLSTDIISRMIYWGEARSDNFDLLTESWDEMKNYMNANLLASNSISKWASFYTAIGYCNNVLKHGPNVVNLDASFSEEDWKPIQAEMKALRALNYFYLVRAFRDVPLTMESISTDKEALAQKKRQSSAQEVLTAIINDLDSVKNDGMRNYETTTYNKGRFSRWSIHTLLADMYLWRASKNASADSVAKYPDNTGEGYASQSARDYAKVIEYCDVVLNHYLEEYKKNNTGVGMTQENEDKDNPYHLITLNNSGSSKDVSDEIYNNIFVDGNSREGIFELQFDGSKNVNSVLYNRSGSVGLYTAVSAQSGNFQASSPCQSVSDDIDPSSGLYSKTDIRRWESMVWTESGQKVYPIGKYASGSVFHKDLEDNSTGATITKLSVQGSCNWIVYRLSDVLLMKAEALNYLYDDEEHRQEAFNLIAPILYRSNPSVTDEKNKLSFSEYNTRSSLGDLILRERRREFFGEGKRWFDLVRLSEREGSTTTMLSSLLTKYSSNSSAIKAKTSSLNSLYNPVHEDELKVNTYLYQNPAWDKAETITRN